MSSLPQNLLPTDVFKQGCQIFLDTIDQNWGKYTKLPLNCH
jgi:hypothetical protein